MNIHLRLSLKDRNWSAPHHLNLISHKPFILGVSFMTITCFEFIVACLVLYTLGCKQSEMLKNPVSKETIANQTTKTNNSKISKVENLKCPEDYILVPGRNENMTKDFCVMKFQARPWNDKNQNELIDSDEIFMDGYDTKGFAHEPKNAKTNWGIDNYLPTSVSEGLPWMFMSRGEIQEGGQVTDGAIKACRNLNMKFKRSDGLKFDLMNNNEWQTIAHDVEEQKENWVGEIIGEECIKVGNTGNRPYKCSYIGGRPESGANPNAKLVLSNGSEIYHFSGNLKHWIMDDNLNLSPGTPTYMADLPGSQFGPLKRYACSTKYGYCGFGYSWFNFRDKRGVVRGGSNLWGTPWGFAGLYSTTFVEPSKSYEKVGFRCVLH
jgi:hypothetical protein